MENQFKTGPEAWYSARAFTFGLSAAVLLAVIIHAVSLRSSDKPAVATTSTYQIASPIVKPPPPPSLLTKDSDFIHLIHSAQSDDDLLSLIEAAGGGAEPARRGAQGSDPKKRLELAGLRGDVAFVSSEFRLSERTACKLLEVERSSYRYEPRPDRNAELRIELVKLARQKPRYGYRSLHALLSRRGHEVNVNRVYRLYVEEGLMVRRKRRKRLVREQTAEPRLARANQEWAMDFIVDGLATGRMVRILSVVDAFTRECLALEADTSLGSVRVTRVLERLISERGRPENVRSDNVAPHEALGRKSSRKAGNRVEGA